MVQHDARAQNREEKSTKDWRGRKEYPRTTREGFPAFLLRGHTLLSAEDPAFAERSL